jgi:hypothetical protein
MKVNGGSCEQLEKHGIDLETMCGCEPDPSSVKAICMVPDIKKSVREIGQTHRDQVVMVRIDEDTNKALDLRVETGAVKSRSEAAALFISEELIVRASELEKLKGALQDVETALERLRKKPVTCRG